MLVASVYLRTRDGGASAYNFEILSYTGSLLSEHRMPWLIGGDFQMSPDEVAETMFPATAQGRILADFSPNGDPHACDRSVVHRLLHRQR